MFVAREEDHSVKGGALRNVEAIVTFNSLGPQESQRERSIMLKYHILYADNSARKC